MIAIDDAWSELYSGTCFNLTKPDPGQILLSDIAVSLSRICRFNGHCRAFYSVAQHSVIVFREMDNVAGWDDLDAPTWRATLRAALLHDAHEAYLGDVISPVKQVSPAFVALDGALRAAMSERFDLSAARWELVKQVDLMVLRAEAEDLMPSRGTAWGIAGIPRLPLTEIVPWAEARARNEFLSWASSLGLTEAMLA